MEAASPSKYLLLYAKLSCGMLLGIVAINAIVDPLWVYHAPWLSQTYVRDQRQANPGLARFSSYDSVVIGNSLTENYLVTEIESCLKWRPLKLCIAGSTPREQRLVLDQALATGQVRDVLWSIDLFSLELGPDAVRSTDFPFHLYNRDMTTPWKYLLSGSTFCNSLKVGLGGGAKDMESRYVWYYKSKFGLDQMIVRWRSDVSDPNIKPVNEEIAWNSVETHLLDEVRSHPEVRFHFVVPPYSSLYRVSELVTAGNHFAARMKFKRKLAQALLEFPNVELFDFETARDVTQDTGRYMDLVHFDLPTSTAILHWMADGQYRMTRDSIDQQIHELEDGTHRYAQTIFSADNPFRDRLRIDELGLTLPPSVDSVTTPDSRSNPPRTASSILPSKN